MKMWNRSLLGVPVKTNHLALVEFVYWVLAVAAGVIGFLAIPSVLFGNGLVTLKFALFVVGFIVFGLGSFAIQPSPHGKGPLSRGFSWGIDSDDVYEFEKRIQQLPPLEGEWLPIQHRVSRNIKLFVASLLILGFSMFLEFGLGVTAQ